MGLQVETTISGMSIGRAGVIFRAQQVQSANRGSFFYAGIEMGMSEEIQLKVLSASGQEAELHW